jgi:uncharacterized delta-60 repeat protein
MRFAFHLVGALLLPPLLLLSTAVSQAQPGDLDTTCGVNGVVSLNMFTNSQGNGGMDYINGIAVYFATTYVGGSSKDPATTTSLQGFLAAKLDSNGNFDPSFGNGGRVVIDWGPFMSGAFAIAINGNQQVFLAGFHSPNVFSSRVAVAKLTASGQLDNTFGTGGKVSLNVGQQGAGLKIAIQSDGKILVLASKRTSYNSPPISFLVRLLSNGSLDTSFGLGGFLDINFANLTSFTANALALHSNQGVTDKIIVAGSAPIGNHSGFAVARYNIDGTPDISYGANGVTTFDVGNANGGGNARVTSVLVDPDLSIVAAGSHDDLSGSKSTVVVARFKPDGSVNSGFGKGGSTAASYNSPPGAASHVVNEALSGTNIIVTGTLAQNGEYAFAATRYFKYAGAVDDRFGWKGEIRVPFIVDPGYAHYFKNTDAAYIWTIGSIFGPGKSRLMIAGQAVVNSPNASTDLVMAAVNGGGCQ